VKHHLAQINIARFRLPADDPANKDFVDAIESVNAAADAQPGFVWRLQGDGAGALDIRAYDDPNIVVNMSVWESLDQLAAFAYRHNVHRSIMRRRREWFEEMEFYLALWWIEAGTTPTVEEAVRRIELIKASGPSPEAFTFKTPFPPPGERDIEPVLDECA
jgi:heme-degrading monooxygenase HmoA